MNRFGGQCGNRPFQSVRCSGRLRKISRIERPVHSRDLVGAFAQEQFGQLPKQFMILVSVLEGVGHTNVPQRKPLFHVIHGFSRTSEVRVMQSTAVRGRNQPFSGDPLVSISVAAAQVVCGDVLTNLPRSAAR